MRACDPLSQHAARPRFFADAPNMHRVLLPALALLLACTNSSKVGAPCNVNEDCGGDLICDFHEGKGSCQQDHEHSAGESDAHASESHGTTQGHVTTGEHGTTSHEHPTSEHGETHHAATTGDDVAAACATYCACLQDSCSAHDQFPHADLAACETACAGFTDVERTCWSEYCELAQVGDDDQANYCEHASGAGGLAECG